MRRWGRELKLWGAIRHFGIRRKQKMERSWIVWKSMEKCSLVAVLMFRLHTSEQDVYPCPLSICSHHLVWLMQDTFPCFGMCKFMYLKNLSFWSWGNICITVFTPNGNGEHQEACRSVISFYIGWIMTEWASSCFLFCFLSSPLSVPEDQ